MRTATKIGLALLGAVVLASGAFALGTQLDDGSAVAAKSDSSGSSSTTPKRTKPGAPGGPGFWRGGPEGLADELGVEEDALEKALDELRDELPDVEHVDLAQALADGLNVDRDRAREALRDARPDLPDSFDEARKAVAAELARILGVSEERARDALEQIEPRRPWELADAFADVATALGVTEERLVDALGEVNWPAITGVSKAIADELGVSVDRVEQILRDAQKTQVERMQQRRDQLVDGLARKLGISADKVRDAIGQGPWLGFGFAFGLGFGPGFGHGHGPHGDRDRNGADHGPGMMGPGMRNGWRHP
ncbi:MAG: hypothetical protein IRZ32_08990 [Solirubrobacteraceae bacterium]|nr:hypothetical protein [Solirubrobacteraceae bacterium]